MMKRFQALLSISTCAATTRFFQIEEAEEEEEEEGEETLPR